MKSVPDNNGTAGKLGKVKFTKNNAKNWYIPVQSFIDQTMGHLNLGRYLSLWGRNCKSTFPNPHVIK